MSHAGSGGLSNFRFESASPQRADIVQRGCKVRSVPAMTGSLGACQYHRTDAPFELHVLHTHWLSQASSITPAWKTVTEQTVKPSGYAWVMLIWLLNFRGNEHVPPRSYTDLCPDTCNASLPPVLSPSPPSP